MLFISYRRKQAERLRQQNLFRASTKPSPELLRAKRRVQEQKNIAAQQRISKVRGIFESTPEYIKPAGATVELQDWVAFVLLALFILFVVHFFVGWWTILGCSVVGVNSLFFLIEIQQRRISIKITSDSNYRVPPASIHGISIALQTLLLTGFIWLPHWISIFVQVLLSGSAIFILHRLRNPTVETIFTKKK